MNCPIKKATMISIAWPKMSRRIHHRDVVSKGFGHQQYGCPIAHTTQEQNQHSEDLETLHARQYEAQEDLKVMLRTLA